MSAISDHETIIVETRRVSCDGGGGPLGHPRVYMQIGSENWVACKYCDRRYVLKPRRHSGYDTLPQ